MAQLFPTPRPPYLGQNWSAYILIVAVLFLLAVFLFYYYTLPA